jgi:hypothetical protein
MFTNFSDFHQKMAFLKEKGCPGWGANPRSFDSHSITVPLSHSGSPKNGDFI